LRRNKEACLKSCSHLPAQIIVFGHCVIWALFKSLVKPWLRQFQIARISLLWKKMERQQKFLLLFLFFFFACFFVCRFMRLIVYYYVMRKSITQQLAKTSALVWLKFFFNQPRVCTICTVESFCETKSHGFLLLHKFF